MKFIRYLFVLCSCMAIAQQSPERDQLTASSAQVTAKSFAGKHTETSMGVSLTHVFEFQFDTAPTYTYTITPCMRGGSCLTPTTASVSANTAVAISGTLADYYNVTVTWSGGTATTLKVNILALPQSAKGNSGGGGDTITSPNGTITVGGSSSATTLDVAHPSALVLLEEHTASNSASLAFTSCISSTYDTYEVQVVQLLPATALVDINLQVSSNAGSTYDTGNNYNWNSLAARASGSPSQPSGSAVSSISVAGVAGLVDNTAANGGLNGSFTFWNPLGGVGLTHFRGLAVFWWTVGPQDVQTDWSANYKAATTFNAFRIQSSSGNLTSGTVRCYGVAK